MSGQWFSGWAACVRMKAAPTNWSDPEEHSSELGRESLGTHETIFVFSPRLAPFLPLCLCSLLCCSRFFFFLLFDFPSLSSISRALRASSGLYSPCWRPSGSQRLLSPVSGLLSLLGRSWMREFLHRSITRLMKMTPGSWLSETLKSFLNEVVM